MHDHRHALLTLFSLLKAGSVWTHERKKQAEVWCTLEQEWTKVFHDRISN